MTIYTEEDYLRDTLVHIGVVRRLLSEFSNELTKRAFEHDASKLVEPEKSIFIENTKSLEACAFDSDDYINHRKKVKVALDHHYANNRHHPEHHANGIPDMNLFDIVEMFCDWAASSAKNNNGDTIKSIRVCKERFGFSDELESILINTVRYTQQQKELKGLKGETTTHEDYCNRRSG